MSVFVQPIGVGILLALLSIHTEAMLCWMGQEPDSNAAHRYRWVIPVENPCNCTEIRPGGINNRAPGRHFKVIYFDTILISNSQKEIHKWLNCSVSAVVNGEVMGSVPASQSATITTYATGKAPVTSDISVTSFNCPTKEPDNTHYADPNDCTMFYQCANGVAYHQPCAPGLYFIDDRCALQEEASCNV